ncbi:MAG TPA: BamA/TamA family outer membrane protein [Opitutaceae bacterium]|nr:BamA/TamA family outer membrane protein [Opitutaceae bacterium]
MPDHAPLRLTFLAVVLAVAAPALVCARPAIKVTGMGWLRDREMRISLQQLIGARKADHFDANAVEDGAVILDSALIDEGFERPTIDLELKLSDGAIRRVTFDPTFAHPIPRPLDARAVTFHVHPGIRWRVAEVRIEGLTAVPAKSGEAYFRTGGMLFVVSRTNAYSRSQLDRSADALLDELKRRGYAEATVRASVAHVNQATGAVALVVVVHQGPRWVVRQVAFRPDNAKSVKLPNPKPWQGQNWTPKLNQDIREAVRLAYYQAGYPDVSVHLQAEAEPTTADRRETSLIVSTVSGRRVTMGRVRFVGNTRTRTSVLERRISIKPGAPLNPVELEHARYRIARLGVFDSVDLHYEPPQGKTRDPVFVLKEGPPYETDLLFGYGSYEQLRGGVEYRQMNAFGLAHQSRLQLVQSMKSTRGEYTYTVPELFGETVDGTAKLFGLQRQEIAFERQEYGATFSLERAIPAIHGEATAGYTFQALRNRDNSLSVQGTEKSQVNVASLDLGLRSENVDNPLRPRRGYRIYAQAELASPNLGGVAQYQRVEVSGAYHTPWGQGHWIHLGLSHGFITTFGAPNDSNLPVNKRFYPGGDNSIRGYRAGEAAPRAADGLFIGAKSYVLFNLQLEQALTPNWSIVAFGDALGETATMRDYPFHDRLYSVGIGLWYQTIIGPIRIEYGRNLNPRPSDPSGTLQIAIGYPF